MKDRGIDVTLNQTSEVLGNVAGGMRRGTVHEGLMELAPDADLEKLVG